LVKSIEEAKEEETVYYHGSIEPDYISALYLPELLSNMA